MTMTTLRQLALLLQAEIHGSGDVEIETLKSLEDAGQSSLSLFAASAFENKFKTTQSAAVLVEQKLLQRATTLRPDITLLSVENAHKKFLSLYQLFFPDKELTKGIHQSALVASTAFIHESASVSAYVVVGERSYLGANVTIHAGCVVGDDCHIGEETTIFPNAVLYDGCIIGSNCIIHSGAVIGSDGFGYHEEKDKSFTKIPQVGNVVLEDNVEIGANSTIDRAALGSTIIRRGTKIDNLVHIAHNVEVGENTAIAALSGVAGSTRLGARNRLAGQVGVIGHLDIADDVIVFAQSGVGKSIEKPGIYFGSPIMEHMTGMRVTAAQRKLPELIKRVQELEEKLKNI